MPIQFKVGEISGEFPEKGSYKTTRTVEGKELTSSVEIREAINKQNRKILKGYIHKEDIAKRSEIRRIKEEDKYELRIDGFHNLTISESEIAQQGYSIKEANFIDLASSSFYIFDDYIVYGTQDVTSPQRIVSRCIGVDIEDVTIRKENIADIFESTYQKTLKDIDELTTTATITGEVDDSDEFQSLNKSGDIVWGVGDIVYSDEAYKVGLSSKNDTVVVYGKVSGVKAAELALHIMVSQ